MNVGLVSLESTLHFMVLVLATTDVPTASDAVPSYTIYGPDGTAMANGTGVTAAVSGKTGLYRGTHSILASDGYAAGSTYELYVQYAITTARGQLLYFTVT